VVGSLFGRIGDGTEAPSCEGSRELLYQDAHVACFIPMVRLELSQQTHQK